MSGGSGRCQRPHPTLMVFNLADVAKRLNDEGQRQAAFRAALAVKQPRRYQPPRGPDPEVGRYKGAEPGLDGEGQLTTESRRRSRGDIERRARSGSNSPGSNGFSPRPREDTRHGGNLRGAASPTANDSRPEPGGPLPPIAGESRRSATLVGRLGLLVLFLFLLRDVLWHFYYSWTTDENYSHGFLVPADRLTSPTRRPAGPGGGPRRRAGRRGGDDRPSGLIRLLTIPLRSRSWASSRHRGPGGVVRPPVREQALLRYWFAFTFLVFMVPLPVAVYSKLASPLQLLASQVATAVMNATGVPVLREGNT